MEQETRTARDAGAPVKIGAEAVRAAAEVLRRYRAGKCGETGYLRNAG